MTLLYDYASTMLDCYLEDYDWQPEAVAHYLRLMQEERMKMEEEAKRLEHKEQNDGIQ